MVSALRVLARTRSLYGATGQLDSRCSYRRGARVKRRTFITLVGGAAGWPLAARAQQGERGRRIGWLTAQRAASLTPYVEVMRSALADLGYVEGRNLAIEFRYGDDAIERVPDLAAELVRLPVDLIVAQGAAVPIISRLGLP